MREPKEHWYKHTNYLYIIYLIITAVLERNEGIMWNNRKCRTGKDPGKLTRQSSIYLFIYPRLFFLGTHKRAGVFHQIFQDISIRFGKIPPQQPPVVRCAACDLC